jgi:hypothetical protein
LNALPIGSKFHHHRAATASHAEATQTAIVLSMALISLLFSTHGGSKVGATQTQRTRVSISAI